MSFQNRSRKPGAGDRQLRWVACSITLLLVAGLTGVSYADPVATGSFQLTSYVAAPPPNPFEVVTTFSSTGGPNGDGTFSAFGYDFNLAAAIGSIIGTGTTSGTTGSPESGSFGGTYSDANLSFTTFGDFVCDILGCISGLPISFVGTIAGITAAPIPGNLVNDPDIVYTFDGSAICNPGPAGTNVCAGTFAINAFRRAPTPMGSNVPVTISTIFIHPETLLPIPTTFTVTYDTVTCPGDTLITTVSNAAGNLSSSFATDIGGFLAAFFDISTTACVTGPITICSSYLDEDNNGILDGTEMTTSPVSECQMRVLHEEAGTFVDRTLAATDPSCPPLGGNDICDGSKKSDAPCIDKTNNVVCAQVGSFSAFVTAVEVAELDHYLCYKVRDLKQPPFDAGEVSLQDQFSSQLAGVRRLDSVCAPVDKNGEGISDPNSHLCCYKVKTDPLKPRPLVEITSQFQSSQVEVKKSRLLCAPCVKNPLP